MKENNKEKLVRSNNPAEKHFQMQRVARTCGKILCAIMALAIYGPTKNCNVDIDNVPQTIGSCVLSLRTGISGPLIIENTETTKGKSQKAIGEFLIENGIHNRLWEKIRGEKGKGGNSNITFILHGQQVGITVDEEGMVSATLYDKLLNAMPNMWATVTNTMDSYGIEKDENGKLKKGEQSEGRTSATAKEIIAFLKKNVVQNQ